MKTIDLTPGTYLELQFGNGTQLFLVTSVSKKGKPFGYRLNASRGAWDATSIRVDDPRIIGRVENAEVKLTLAQKDCGMIHLDGQDDIIKRTREYRLRELGSSIRSAARLPLTSAEPVRDPESCWHGTVTWAELEADRLEWSLKRVAKITARLKVLRARRKELAGLGYR